MISPVVIVGPLTLPPLPSQAVTLLTRREPARKPLPQDLTLVVLELIQILGAIWDSCAGRTGGGTVRQVARADRNAVLC